MISGNKGELDSERRGDERIFEDTQLGRTTMTKGLKGTPNPLMMIAVGMLSKHPFSWIFSSSSLTTNLIALYSTRFVQ